MSEPLFRRAFSIYDYDEKAGITDVLYQVVGRGTYQLSTIQAGQDIDVIGPLGNGFNLPDLNSHLIIVTGGIGLPPLYLLAKYCLRMGFSGKQITFLCGFTSCESAGMAERVGELPIDLQYSSDDGSIGFKGLVTKLLEQKLQHGLAAITPLICACGPHGMLKEVKSIAAKNKLRCYLSLESMMPCAVGTCMGCVVKKEGKEDYLRVCREGPVFDASEVEL